MLSLQVTQSTEISLASAANTLNKVGQQRWAHTRAKGGSAREGMSMAQKMVLDRARLSFCSGIPGFDYLYSSTFLITEDKAAPSCLWELLQGT